MKKKTKTEEVLCHMCKQRTEHKLMCSDQKKRNYRVHGDNEDQMSGSYLLTTDVLKCLGCREYAIRCTENWSDADYPVETFYPPRPYKQAEESRQLPDWADSLPTGIKLLLTEVYSAIGTHSYRLAAMGLRALMDELMTHTLGDIGGFEQKVNKMVSDGLLSKVQKEVLDPTLELGHAATHRSHRPSSSQLEAALGIVEGMLNLFYVQKGVVGELKRGVKPRQKTKTSGGPTKVGGNTT